MFTLLQMYMIISILFKVIKHKEFHYFLELLHGQSTALDVVFFPVLKGFDFLNKDVDTTFKSNAFILIRF